MEINTPMKEIVFGKMYVYGEVMEVSQPLAMSSNAGWYCGAICKGEYGVEPFDRYTGYMTKEEAIKVAKEMKDVWDENEATANKVEDEFYDVLKVEGELH